MANQHGQEQERRGYRATLNEFAESTSLHGVGYLGSIKGKPWCYDWFFFVAISVGLLCTFTLVLIQINDFSGARVSTSFSGAKFDLSSVGFPSLTVCNTNRLRRSFIEEYELEEHLPLLKKYYWGSTTEGGGNNMTADELKQAINITLRPEIVAKGSRMQGLANNGTGSLRHKTFLSTFDNTSSSLFLLAALQEPEEKTILELVYRGERRDPNDWAQLHPYVLTDYGYCSLVDVALLFHYSYRNLSFSEMANKKIAESFRTEGTEDEEKEFLGIGVGPSQGLDMIIDAEAYDYGFAPEHGEGVKIAISNFRDEAPMTVRGLDFGTGTRQQISLSPTITKTTKVARNRFDYGERECYFQDEFKLDNYGARGKRQVYSSMPCVSCQSLRCTLGIVWTIASWRPPGSKSLRSADATSSATTAPARTRL